MNIIVFHYRARRHENKESIPAFAGERIQLAENIEYLLEFNNKIDARDQGALNEAGFEFITPQMGVLCFSNFVGVINICGVRLEVQSSKLGHGGTSALLEEISLLSSALVFGWRSPASFATSSSLSSNAPIPFHQLQFLRDVILKRSAGQRLQDYFSIVERNPIRHFRMHREVINSEKAKSFDWRALTDVFKHSERLGKVRQADPLAGHPLSKALRIGNPPQEHFPFRVSTSSRQLSYDTLENRFVKHFLSEALSIVYRLLDKKNIHTQMKTDCREMAAILEMIIRSDFLQDVSALTVFSGPTQSLSKCDGYKDLFDLWLQMGSHQSLPTSHTQIERLLQGKDVALLYEYWVFLNVLAAATEAESHKKFAVKVTRNELGEHLDRGITVILSDQVTVAFNPSYIRSKGDVYSTPLRPDVILSVNGTRYAFDAKYKLQWQTAIEDVQNDDATYIRADLYKMHTYRDAITKLKAAFVVYPGTEFVFFERNIGRHSDFQDVSTMDGVGAIPLRPECTQNSPLKFIISTLLAAN